MEIILYKGCGDGTSHERGNQAYLVLIGSFYDCEQLGQESGSRHRDHWRRLSLGRCRRL
jgi:hypothetical protein